MVCALRAHCFLRRQLSFGVMQQERQMSRLPIKRGDIVWVDFGEAGGVAKGGEHPALVVQNNRGNAVSPMTIVVPLTDARQFKQLPVQVLLSSAETGLANKESCVECGHIIAVDREVELLEERGVVGHVAPDAMRRVDDALRVSLGLTEG